MASEAVASAARLVHPNAPRPCVAILTKPKERLAARTKADVTGVGATLLDQVSPLESSSRSQHI